MSVRELKRSILENCDTLQAILAFNYQLTAEVKERLDVNRSIVLTTTARELRRIQDAVEEDVVRVAAFFGSLQKPKQFAAEFIASTNKASIATISKAAIDSKYFTKFCHGVDAWKNYPPHLRLVIDFNRICSSDIRFDYILTEAMLYEDMALAYNEAVTLEPDTRSVRDTHANVQVKKLQFVLRTATLSAFYFVEAYLNGIGYDHYHRHESDLPDYEKTILLDWDFQKSRSAWVSFERKVLDHPRIMLRAKHPPLTSTNSKNLKILLGEAKEFRDAIVHQSPKTNDVLAAPQKVFLMLALHLPQVTEIVDAAVGFVIELNKVLGIEGMMLDWLFSRNQETGLFPPESFT